MLTKEQRVENLALWIRGLNSVGVNTDLLIDKYGVLLQDAPLGDKSDMGMAYEGALINQSFRLSKLSKGINDLLPSELQVDKKTLVKVCLLANIAKCTMFVPCTEKWKIDKGILWNYAKVNYALRTGQLSLLMLQECGIYLSYGEAEAILNLDALDDDVFVKINSSVLATIIKNANNVMWAEKFNLTKIENKEDF